MVVLVMFCMMSVVVVASAAIPSLCLLHRGPGRHVAADRGWRLLDKETIRNLRNCFVQTSTYW